MFWLNAAVNAFVVAAMVFAAITQFQVSNSPLADFHDVRGYGENRLTCGALL